MRICCIWLKSQITTNWKSITWLDLDCVVTVGIYVCSQPRKKSESPLTKVQSAPLPRTKICTLVEDQWIVYLTWGLCSFRVLPSKAPQLHPSPKGWVNMMLKIDFMSISLGNFYYHWSGFIWFHRANCTTLGWLSFPYQFQLDEIYPHVGTWNTLSSWHIFNSQTVSSPYKNFA